MRKDSIRFYVFASIILLTIQANIGLGNDNNEILLKSRHFTPQRGITASSKAAIEAVPGRVHVLLQLEREPTPEDINQLENAGVKLFSYIPNKAGGYFKNLLIFGNIL